MKFYDCSTAPSPRRVRIFLAEKGVELETVQVDLGSGEQFGDAFRRVNPDCVAICQYLEERYPEPPLLGCSAEERARVSMWNAKVEQQGLMAVMEALRNFAKSFRGRAVSGPAGHEQIPGLAERGRRRTLEFYDRLDARLADSRYLASEHF